MNENDLGRALLKLDASALAGTPDTRLLTGRILEHDRRHLRTLTVLTLLIWLLALGLVGLVLVGFGLLFPMQAKLVQETEAGRIEPQHRQALDVVHQQTSQVLTLAIAFSVGILALAALSTVRLIFASRRATLRQVNANLLEISGQLKELRAALAKPAAGPDT